MYAFRQRPLTWLFLIATVCLDIALLGIKVNAQHMIVAMLFGQSFVIGGWLVLGRGHRLLRAGLFVAATIGLALLATFRFVEGPHFKFREAWGHSIGAVAILASGAAVMTWGWRSVLRWLSRGRREPVEAPRWQFPLAELFGWTIFVAVASAVMRVARFAHAGNNVDEVAATLTFALVAALLMALLLDENRHTGLLSWIIAVVAVAAMFTLLPMFVRSFNREIAVTIAGAYVYVMLWILVRRLDEHSAAKGLKGRAVTAQGKALGDEA